MERQRRTAKPSLSGKCKILTVPVHPLLYQDLDKNRKARIINANCIFNTIHCIYSTYIQIKKREYRDGIKSKETRLGWGEAHNVYKACVGIYHGGILAIMCT